MIFNAALLFSDTHNSAFVAYSGRLAKEVRVDFQLGDASLPHLTLIQYEADESTVKSIVERLSRLGTQPIALDLFGLTAIPTKDGNAWLEISVLKTRALGELQKSLIEIVGAPSVRSGTGDAYRPHITLARGVNVSVLTNLRLEEKVLRRKDVLGYLALGVSGENFQLTKILWRREIEAFQRQ